MADGVDTQTYRTDVVCFRLRQKSNNTMARKQNKLSTFQTEPQNVALSKTLSAEEIPTEFLGYADLMVKLWSRKDFSKPPPTLVGRPEHEEVRVRCQLWLRKASEGTEDVLEGWWILTTPLVFYVYREVFRKERAAQVRNAANNKPPWHDVERDLPNRRFQLMENFIDLALRPGLETADSVRLTNGSSTDFETFCKHNGTGDIRSILLDPLLLNFVERGVWTRLESEDVGAANGFSELLSQAFRREHNPSAITVTERPEAELTGGPITPLSEGKPITDPVKQSAQSQLSAGKNSPKATDDESD